MSSSDPQVRTITAADAARVLAPLVQTHSQNGEDVIDGEAAVVDQIIAFLDGTGCEVKRVPLPGHPRKRQSLGARLAGRGGGPVLVLNGHIDTVPVGDASSWSMDPFAGAIVAGELYGRGSADMKGGVTALILAIQVLATLPPEDRPDVVLHCAADEEQGGGGTVSLLDAGYTGDVGICAEPTKLEIAVAMRGMTGYRVVIRGRAAHVGYPERGQNPIEAGPAVLDSLLRFDRTLRSERTHAITGPAQVIPTIVRAGVEHCSIPDTLEIVIDRRLIPGETQELAVAELDRLVDHVMRGYPKLTWSSSGLDQLAPVLVEPDTPFVTVMTDAVAQVTGRQVSVSSTPYASDVTHLKHHGGITAVTFGPGDCALAHSADERIPIADVATAANAVVTAALAL